MPNSNPIVPSHAQNKVRHPEQFSNLMNMCSEFLKAKIPPSNIVPESEFAEFIPLFNEESIKELGKDGIDKLAKKYRGRFSLQHPIHIISAEQADDTEGDVIKSPHDNKFHRIVITLPPMFRSLRTLNDLGERVPSLIDALMNTVARKDTYMNSTNDYYRGIAEAMSMANPSKDKQKSVDEFVRIDEKFKHLKSTADEEPVRPVAPSIKTQDDAITTGSSMFEW